MKKQKTSFFKWLFSIKNLKYVTCSISASLLELGIFYLMTSIIWEDKAYIILIGTLVSRFISTIMYFFLNKYWCFRVFNRTAIQAIESLILFAVKLYLSYFFVNMIVNKYSINPTLIKMPIDISLFFVGYVVQNYIIFREVKDKKKDKSFDIEKATD